MFFSVSVLCPEKLIKRPGLLKNNLTFESSNSSEFSLISQKVSVCYFSVFLYKDVYIILHVYNRSDPLTHVSALLDLVVMSLCLQRSVFKFVSEMFSLLTVRVEKIS